MNRKRKIREQTNFKNGDAAEHLFAYRRQKLISTCIPVRRQNSHSNQNYYHGNSHPAECNKPQASQPRNWLHHSLKHFLKCEEDRNSPYQIAGPICIDVSERLSGYAYFNKMVFVQDAIKASIGHTAETQVKSHRREPLPGLGPKQHKQGKKIQPRFSVDQRVQ